MAFAIPSHHCRSQNQRSSEGRSSSTRLKAILGFLLPLDQGQQVRNSRKGSMGQTAKGVPLDRNNLKDFFDTYDDHSRKDKARIKVYYSTQPEGTKVAPPSATLFHLTPSICWLIWPPRTKCSCWVQGSCYSSPMQTLVAKTQGAFPNPKNDPKNPDTMVTPCSTATLIRSCATKREV